MARKKALEGIVYLAFQDEQALAHLKSLRAAETIKDQMSYFLDYCDKSIVMSAELALACIEATDVFRLVKEFGDDSQSVYALLDFMRYNSKYRRKRHPDNFSQVQGRSVLSCSPAPFLPRSNFIAPALGQRSRALLGRYH